MSDEWMAAWQPLIDAVGRDFSQSSVTVGADELEAATVRRYLEPLEFDCALHYDVEVAFAHGYGNIPLPCTAILSFSLPPMWRPGETIFTSNERNAQPTSNAITGVVTSLEPPTTGYFATNYEAEYLRPALVGDRLSRRGAKLLACIPKETKIGRGAFLTWESEVINQHDETISVMRTTYYRYNPQEKARR